MAEQKTERKPPTEEKIEKPAPSTSARPPLFSPAGFLVAMVLAVVTAIGGFTLSGMFGKTPDVQVDEPGGKDMTTNHKVSLGQIYAKYQVDYGRSDHPPMFQRLICEPVLYLSNKIDDETKSKIEKNKERLRDIVQDLLMAKGKNYSEISRDGAKDEMREKIKKRLNEELKGAIGQVVFNEWDFRSE